MRILITGGLGYIGGRIADYIKKKKPSVEIFLTTRRKERALPQWTKDFTILKMDLADEASISRCLSKTKPDLIIHLAAVNEIDSRRDPVTAFDINTMGTYRLLKGACRRNLKGFIYFSTFHVYGVIPDEVITEQTPTRPFRPYAISHRAAEDIVNYFGHYYGVKTLILRLSNSYGYPMHKDVERWNLVFNDLCRQVVTTGRIILKTSGRQRRDFISLYDVAGAVYHFIFIVADKWADGLYNLGGNYSTPILEVARLIAGIYSRIYKKKIKIYVKRDGAGTLTGAKLAYGIDKLLKTGFRLKGNIEEEVIKTLKVCEGFLDGQG